LSTKHSIYYSKLATHSAQPSRVLQKGDSRLAGWCP